MIIDLKLKLTLQVVMLAAICFFSASAFVLLETDRTGRSKAESLADLVGKALTLQQEQIHWSTPAQNRFPDLQVIATSVMAPGLCIGYRPKDGEPLQQICDGIDSAETQSPALFSMLYRSVFKPGAEYARPIAFHNQILGNAIVTLNPESLIAQSWRETTKLLTIVAVTLLALCILVYAALTRALRPTHVIVSGLKQLSNNDLSTRLPPFDLAELSAIQNVFNGLAEKLQAALAERNCLTDRLIAVQDEERRHLARELHDEFGQCLVGISAIAASARQTAEKDCPALAMECQSIAQIATQMMETLRGALVRLRPPDVEEFGLTASLKSLVSAWNRRSGHTRFEIDIHGHFDSFPLSFCTSLYRIAQEAITNAAKHAAAAHVDLRLAIHAGTTGERQIELTVADDGAAADVDLSGKFGMGLVGMRERISALGGRLSFEPGHPSGLSLHAVIPAPRMVAHTHIAA